MLKQFFHGFTTFTFQVLKKTAAMLQVSYISVRQKSE